MTENEQKQQFSYAYLHAVAARAGFTVDRPSTDYESIDAIVGTAGEINGRTLFRSSPKIGVQLKATAADCRKADHVAFELEMKNYNDLRRPTLVPQLLVVLLLPANQIDWISLTEEQLIARRCAYWISLSGLPALPNKSTTTLHIPRLNQLTIEAMKDLMTRIDKGERP